MATRAGEHLGGVLPTSNLFAPHREQDAGEAFGNVRGGPSVENSSSKWPDLAEARHS
jgi:hypothetical protein